VSRLHCVFAFDDLPTAKAYLGQGAASRTLPPERVYPASPLDPSSPRVRLDMLWVGWLSEGGDRSTQIARCHGYWSGQPTSDVKASASPAWEWLFGGALVVVRPGVAGL
jgi:hypothetical protein